MVRGLPAAQFAIPVEEGELAHPEEVEFLFAAGHERLAQRRAHRAERLAGHRPVVGHEEKQVAGLRAERGAHRPPLAEKLADPPLEARGRHLGPRQPLGAVGLRRRFEVVDLLAALPRPPGHAQSLDRPAPGRGLREHPEFGGGHHVGHRDQVQLEAAVRLVGAVGVHGLAVGQPRKRRGEFDADALAEEMAHEPLHHLVHVVLAHERHLHVDLGVLGLAVGAQILVAQAARELEVAIEPGHHEDLLVELRALGQGVELAGVKARGNDVVAGALGGGAHQTAASPPR